MRKIFNLVGMRFGKLLVIEKSNDYISPKNQHGSMWLCKCDCGNIVEIRASDLRSNRTMSCGCYKSEKISKCNKDKFIDLVGIRFEKLVVMKLDHMDKQYGGVWKCLCDCGIETIVKGINLKSGQTKSCGCLSESNITTEIKKYFIENYNAIIEYRVVKNPETDNYLSYDIYIPNNVFIELNGRQHYVKGAFNISDSEFEHRKKLDKIKKKYAEENGLYIEVDLRKLKIFEDIVKYIEKKL
jgi:hypothetical protein